VWGGGEAGEDGVDRRAAADAGAVDAVGGRQGGGVRRASPRPLPRHPPGPPWRGPPRDGTTESLFLISFLLSWIRLVRPVAASDQANLQIFVRHLTIFRHLVEGLANSSQV
jgi:hypothetical protein